MVLFHWVDISEGCGAWRKLVILDRSQTEDRGSCSQLPQEPLWSVKSAADAVVDPDSGLHPRPQAISTERTHNRGSHFILFLPGVVASESLQTAPGWESGPHFSSQLHQMAALGAGMEPITAPQLPTSGFPREGAASRAFCRESFVTAKEQGHWDCFNHRLIY